jgi:hypothetical protein
VQHDRLDAALGAGVSRQGIAKDVLADALNNEALGLGGAG